MANIRNIAKRSGFSIATVSRYINKSGYVSERTGKIIQRTIDEMNYTPNELARAVFSKTTKSIALMVPNLSNPFFSEMANIIESELTKYGYTLLLYNTQDDKNKEKNHLENIMSNRVAGIITSRTQLKEDYRKINIPVISFENEISEEIVTVSSDNIMGGKLAFDHLYDRGARKILHIRGPESFEATEDRFKGFKNASNNTSVDVDYIKYDTDFNVNRALDQTEALVGIEKYDGIFIFNDIVAASVLRYLRNVGVSVPEDIQVIGYDNSYICEMLSPSLTTINQPIDKIGKVVVEQMIDSINGIKSEVKSIKIEVEVVERETTKRRKNEKY